MSTVIYSIFSFVIIGVLLEQFLPENKISALVKPVIFCAIIVCTVSFFGSIKISFKNANEISEQKEISTQSVWQKVNDNCESSLEEIIKKLCIEKSLNVDEIHVNITNDNNTLNVKNIDIYGIDCYEAKNLISSYYLIPSDCIRCIGG